MRGAGCRILAMYSEISLLVAALGQLFSTPQESSVIEAYSLASGIHLQQPPKMLGKAADNFLLFPHFVCLVAAVCLPIGISG